MKFSTKKIKKYIMPAIIGIVLLIGISVLIDAPNIQKDIYNYQQIQKIRTILDASPKEKYDFRSLEEFNKKFNQNIVPSHNCYFISKIRFGSDGYILGYKYTSFLFSLFSSYYIFPDGKEPHRIICDSDGCIDESLNNFIDIISNPCKD